MHRFIVLAVVVLALLCAATQVQARTEVCQEVSEKQIAALFDRWNASLRTGDPTKVVANYAPRSILLPTVSNRPRVSVREKENYFTHFLARRPVGRIDRRSIQIGCTGLSMRVCTRFGSPTAAKSRRATPTRTAGAGGAG